MLKRSQVRCKWCGAKVKRIPGFVFLGMGIFKCKNTNCDKIMSVYYSGVIIETIIERRSDIYGRIRLNRI